MKTILSLVISILLASNLNAQFVAKVQVKEKIEGLCNEKEVYSLLPMFGDQKLAVSPVSNEEIMNQLDSAVIFLKENRKFKGEGMVGIWINCKGEVVKCEMHNKTKDANLDSQIVAVFAALGK